MTTGGKKGGSDSWPYAEREGVEIIRAEYDDRKDWVQDPKGYFTIKPFHKAGKIACRFYTNDHKRRYLIYGERARDIYNTIVRMGLVSRFEHAAYLGKELMKAEIALRNRLHFNQDEDLDITKKATEKDDEYRL
jgi:dihydropteroate synthase